MQLTLNAEHKSPWVTGSKWVGGDAVIRSSVVSGNASQGEDWTNSSFLSCAASDPGALNNLESSEQICFTGLRGLAQVGPRSSWQDATKCQTRSLVFAQFVPLCAAGRREEGKGELGKMATFAVLRDARGICGARQFV